MNITETDNLLDVELVEEIAPCFRVSALRAKDLIAQMQLIVSMWADEAKRIGISRKEINLMCQAFRS